MTAANTAAPALAGTVQADRYGVQLALEALEQMDAHVYTSDGVQSLIDAALPKLRAALEQPATAVPDREALARLARATGAHAYTNRFARDEPAFAFSIDKLERFAAALLALQPANPTVLAANNHLQQPAASGAQPLPVAGYVVRWGALKPLPDMPHGCACAEFHETEGARDAALLEASDAGFNSEWFAVVRSADVCAALAAAPAAQPVACPTCNGNDAEAPCAYPGQRTPGCLRDKRLAGAAPAAAQPARQYRLLTVGQTVQTSDEVLGDDAATWETVSGVFIGMGWGPMFKPVRRAHERFGAAAPAGEQSA